MPIPPPAAAGGCDCLPRPLRAEPVPAPAATYVLRYEDRWFGVEKRVAFDAPDLVAALAMMEHEPIGRWAELSLDGVLVCRRGGEPGGAADYWVVD
ncbi:hypothetical protein [Sphingopyxis sp. KK2]|uniref:hypothetical protein n=1 Tax=Sphingopyxis sp. KK2 TaxID=1855727 RepID=UPI0011818EE3|nr:hypothetical protein [Sphingopyxis sp. KK2]